MKTLLKKSQGGFTLIEVIAALVIGAIVTAMVYDYFSAALTGSAEPIKRLQEANNLQGVMEKIIADYNRLNTLNLRYKWKTATPYRVGYVVVPPTNNGHFYTCTAAGTSGAEPAWPTTAGATVSDGGASWREGGVILGATGTTETIVWQPSHAYLVNDIMIPVKNSGHYYKCTSAGTTSNSEPAKWKATSYSQNDIVFPSSYNGHYYKCTTAGLSGATEPAWPASGTVNDGAVVWTEAWAEAGTILFSADTTNTVLRDNLYNYLTNNPGRYGTGYTVVSADTKFIKFSGSTEATATGSDEKNILKVTIKDSNSNRTLTEIFTIR
jgi:prepilin-type N-terminal cleavage/methylation domain-containing protein